MVYTDTMDTPCALPKSGPLAVAGVQSRQMPKNGDNMDNVTMMVRPAKTPGKFSPMVAATDVRLALLAATGDGGKVALVEGKVGSQRIARIFKVFKNSSAEAVREALKLKESGFEQGSFEYQTLSECGVFHKVYNAGLGDKVTAEQVPTKEGKLSTSWRERLSYARRLLAEVKDSKAARELAKEAFGAALADNPEATPEELAAAAKAKADDLRAEAAAEKQAKIDAKLTPEALGRALCKTLLRKATAADVREILTAALANLESVETEMIAALMKKEEAKKAA